jgi:hypothetical protein
MNLEELIRWHRKEATRFRARRNSLKDALHEECRWHLSVVAFLQSLSPAEHQKLLAETEREVKLRAVESLEFLVKRLAQEAKDLKRMLSEDVANE